MGANIDRTDDVTTHIEYRTKFPTDRHRVNGPAIGDRQTMDWVRPKRWIEGICLEGLEGGPRHSLLFRRQRLVRVRPSGRNLEHIVHARILKCVRTLLAGGFVHIDL